MTISLGVLAGMGPRSTAPFIDMLIDDCHALYGAKYDMDFPKIHIISLPTPFWPGEKINDSEMIAVLKQGISELISAKVDIIAIPCNLAHCYFDEIKPACAGKLLLHIADTAIERLPEESKQIAILATEPTLNAGFYQRRIKELGKEIIDSPLIRVKTTALISEIKQKGFDHHDVLTGWQELISLAEQHDIDSLLIACTDLSPLIKKSTHSIVMIDTAQSLSRATIQSYWDRLNPDLNC